MEQKPIVNTFGHELSMPEWFIEWQRYMNRLTPEGRRLASERLDKSKDLYLTRNASRWNLNIQPEFDFMKELV